VTTCADHHYLYHAHGSTETGDLLFDLADEFGLRFVLCRGGALESASAHPGFSKTALQPESLEQMVGDIERLKSRYHQDTPDALRRVVVAPTTPTFSLPPTLLRELAHTARGLGLRLHTPVGNAELREFLPREIQLPPGGVRRRTRMARPRRLVRPRRAPATGEIRMLAQTGSGVSHCPVSNARLGSGVAPVPQMFEAGVPISLGVDGVASNESGSMVGEANTAWLIHRAEQGASATTAEDVIHWGTAGGAQVLGLGAVGTLQVGQAADLVIYSLDHPRFFGFHDCAVAPVVAGEPITVKYSVVGGRIVVDNGVIPGLDIERMRAEAWEGVQAMMNVDD
jgi:cytosine/adenosine deaminase-related metal-dependent hydrolase